MESSKTPDIKCLKIEDLVQSSDFLTTATTSITESLMFIKIARVKNVRDNYPENFLFTYDQLKNELTKFTPCPKDDAPCMVAGHFRKNSRETEHLTSKSLIMLDIDRYTGTLEQLKELLQQDLGKYQYLGYSTASHTPEKPRVRIVLFLANDVETVKFRLIAKNFINTLSKELSRSLDIKASTTPNQLMNLPIKPHDAYEKWDCENHGELIEPDYTGDSFNNLSTVETNGHGPIHIKKETLSYNDKQVWYYLDRYPIEQTEYTDWLRVGFALHHQYGGKEKGLQIWNEWSKRDTRPGKYKNFDDLKSRWCGFSGSNRDPITFATVIHEVNRLIAENRANLPIKEEHPVPFYKWRDVRGKKALSTMPNFKVLLHEYNITLKFDAIRKLTIYNFDGAIIEDDIRADTRFTSLFELNNLKSSVIPKYVHDVAKENTFNRWKDWVTGKPWDQTDRFVNFCASVTVEPEYESIKKIYLKKWLIQMLHMTCLNDVNKGNKGKMARMVLTFKGKQGIGKTTWLTSLAPADMSDLIGTGISVDTSNHMEVYACMQHVIVELGELAQTLKKSDAEGFKNFITKSRDGIDHKYDKYPVYYPRTTVFFATTNDDRFLGDTTGNSRFLVLPVLKCDAYHGIDMQQLYAQLMEEAVQITDYNLSVEEKLEQDRINTESEHIEPLEEVYITMHDTDQEPVEICNATYMLERSGVPLSQAANKKTLVDRMAKVLDKFCKRHNKTPKGWWIHPQRIKF